MGCAVQNAAQPALCEDTIEKRYHIYFVSKPKIEALKNGDYIDLFSFKRRKNNRQRGLFLIKISLFLLRMRSKVNFTTCVVLTDGRQHTLRALIKFVR